MYQLPLYSLLLALTIIRRHIFSFRISSKHEITIKSLPVYTCGPNILYDTIGNKAELYHIKQLSYDHGILGLVPVPLKHHFYTKRWLTEHYDYTDMICDRHFLKMVKASPMERKTRIALV